MNYISSPLAAVGAGFFAGNALSTLTHQNGSLFSYDTVESFQSSAFDATISYAAYRILGGPTYPETFYIASSLLSTLTLNAVNIFDISPPWLSSTQDIIRNVGIYLTSPSKMAADLRKTESKPLEYLGDFIDTIPQSLVSTLFSFITMVSSFVLTQPEGGNTRHWIDNYVFYLSPFLANLAVTLYQGPLYAGEFMVTTLTSYALYGAALWNMS